jgi:AraC-like DNA-binding protein
MTAALKTMTVGSSVGERTVSAGYARGLLELAVSKGADRQMLARVAGVSLADLADQDARVPFARYVALMRAAKEITGDAALGLHYGEAVDISEVSIVGLLGQASETMGEAFVQLNRYVKLIVDVDLGDSPQRFRMAFDRGGVWIVDTRLGANDFPELSESAFAQLICGPRRFDDRPFVKAVHFTHPEPAHRAEYDRIFRAPVVFGADRNAFQIDPLLQSQKVARLPRYAFGVLAEKADALLAALETCSSLRGRVESLLMARLHTGEVGMDGVAAKLGLSRQTLFRRLKAEGVTFEAVLDELRRRMAMDYLAARKVSVNETAYLVGFSDPAAFSRAFKRWTGSSPKQMRAA